MLTEDLITLYSARSQTLTERLAAHPEWLGQLLSDQVLTTARTHAQLTQRCAQACTTHVHQGLRHFKYYELLRVMLRDWHLRIPMHEALREWSTIADVCVQEAFAHVFPSTDHWALIALGKLGAQELNISSDIDVLLLHDGAPDAQLAPKYARQFSQLCQERSSDGFVFRVDWDLRPEGRMGSVAPSVHAAVQYYEARGADWERLMLIRARHLAGNPELTRKFTTAVRPFVFPRHGSKNIIEACLRMKQAIAAAHAGHDHNLKIGAGGIRDIEFLVHCLQHLHGGRIPSLQTHSTYAALDALADANILDRAVVQELVQAYDTLRHVEHMIQIDHEAHSHNVPTDETQLQRLAERCHVPEATPAQVQRAIDSARAVATQHFEALFAQAPEQQTYRKRIQENLRSSANAEEELDSLSWSRQQILRTITDQELHNGLECEHVCERLSWLADTIIEEVVRIARQQCGTTQSQLAPFILLSGGSHGALEMDYGSDLDLVFLFDPLENAAPEDCAASMARFSRKILSLLNLPLRYGRLYAVDSGLRPSGRGGVLISSIAAFAQYQQQEVALWEQQALMRTRVLLGPPAQRSQVTDIIQHSAYRLRDLDSVRAEIHRIRSQARQPAATRAMHLKLDRGGVADIESIVQCHQLCHAHSSPPLRVGNTWQALRACREYGLLSTTDANALLEHYSWMRRLLAHYRMKSQSGGGKVHWQGENFAAVCEALQLGTPEAAQNETLTRAAEVAQMYDELFK